MITILVTSYDNLIDRKAQWHDTFMTKKWIRFDWAAFLSFADLLQKQILIIYANIKNAMVKFNVSQYTCL